MIRKAQSKDVHRINYLGKKIISNFTIVNNISKDMESDLKEIFVYEDENEVIAFVLLNKLEDQIEILDIIVDEKYRNKKIATNICEYIFSIYNLNCYLEVNVNNYYAIKLYEKFNFKIINVRKKYYQNNDDAYVMERKI